MATIRKISQRWKQLDHIRISYLYLKQLCASFNLCCLYFTVKWFSL